MSAVLQRGEVHLWTVTLSEVRGAADALSGEERARHDRYHYPTDAQRFAARRAALRSVLGGYVGCAPSDIAFESGAAGKPALAGAGPVFNASSSGDIALIAVARDGVLGVDVEAGRAVTDADAIAERFFTPAECAALRRQPLADRLAAFYRLWTAKEALLKAVGTGLPGGLDRFEVSADPASPPALLHDADDADGRARFHLYPADPGQGYFGALAVDRAGLRVVRCAFEPQAVR